MTILSRRRLAVAVVSATALLATACSGSGDKEQQASSNELTVMAPLFGTAPDPSGELQQAVEKLVGKKLKITWVPNAEYGDKTNVTLASDSIPDLMVVNEKGPSFVKAAEAGAFWDLTGKLDKYPNLKPADEQTAKNTTVNGKTYGIYRVRPLLRSGIVIRKDWLAKLGLQEPKTVDDLYAVAKAFTERDPDGNGKKDTYGLIIPKWPGFYASASPYDVVETWFGAPNGWGERNGKLVPGFDTPEFLTAERWLRKWVTEGLVNPDFATLDSANWNDPFVQGKGGMIIDVNVRATQLLDLFKEKNPKDFDKVTLVGNLSLPDGKKYSYPFTGYNMVIAVSKQHIRTEEQLDQVLQALDKLESKEGSVLLTNGIEGRNFKADGKYAVPINQDDPKVKAIQNDVDKAFIQLGTRASVGMGAYQLKPNDAASRAMREEFDVLMNEDLKTAVFNPVLGVIAPTSISKGQSLQNIIPDARIKYLSGAITEDQLKAEIKRWYDSGGTQIAKETNELAAKVGG
ncbi:carbohydrate ABC transporter substrate-binding protein (CUT1 family) [Kribbella voronezhensis]|uniref:Carbohydrate ABC transporter substrate-binding protein (CUT1 family) n=1 Tax=Kribbella voronezhensis TaxID=2512212 RepID=A0A4R7SVT3_9ACTN|nr:extracellular solute-binding protein [Kribbella voronezhensis]TDU83432.1 carbohydrate ABC transporter substrate-binding protein (CUT1 family) [Kribbella voronezhensis]